MKVLARFVPNTWTMHLVCKDCKSVLEIYESDLKYSPKVDSSRRLPIPEFYYIECIDCGRHNQIKDSKIPHSILRALEQPRTTNGQGNRSSKTRLDV